MSPNTGLRERVITQREFTWLRTFLRERTGIELKDGKEPMVMSRLDRRLRHLDLSSYSAYFGRLREDPAETQIAIDLLTTNETYFFREPKHFAFLRDLLVGLPWRQEPVRVWSAASSTGEEAYSIAMTLAENLRPEQSWEVVGTDISTRVVEAARRGLYPLDAAKHIEPHLLRRFCLRGREEYEGYLAIGPALRKRVSFHEANLTALPPNLGRFDVVFLRNVMIYFGTDTKRTLIGHVARILRPGGYLIVGQSESLSGIESGLRTVRPSIYRAGTGDD